MKLIVTDDAPVTDVKMALAKEHHDRMEVFQELCMRGVCSVIIDNHPMKISVQIGEEIFQEPRPVFPTTVLMARLQLAIHAGQSNLNHPYADAPTYIGAPFPVETWERNPHYDIYAGLAKKITATVKGTATKVRKGLRP